MKNDILYIIKYILSFKEFNFSIYNSLINMYGKDRLIKAFSYIWKNANDSEKKTILDKYYIAYISIELDTMIIDDNSYLILCKKFDETNVIKYFTELLNSSNNTKKVLTKYEKIYFYINDENGYDLSSYDNNDSFKEIDSFGYYLKEIGKTPLLTLEEEKELFTTIRNIEETIFIGKIVNCNYIKFNNIAQVIYSINTDEQLLLLKKFKDFVFSEDKNIIDNYIMLCKKNKVGNNITYTFPDKKTLEKELGLYLKENELIGSFFLNKQFNDILTYYKARNRIIEANLRLVVSIAKRFNYAKMEFNDRVNEGNLGLMTAIKKFDINKGCKFSTYATWWIRQYISRAIDEKQNLIRIPYHTAELVARIYKAFDDLSYIYQRNPTDEEIARYLNIRIGIIKDIRSVITLNNVDSFSAKVGDDGDSELGDFIPSDYGNPQNEVFNESDRKIIMDTIDSRLTPREKEVILCRFGLCDSGEIETLEIIGKRLGITRERVRQIENKALRRLKKPLSKEIEIN